MRRSAFTLLETMIALGIVVMAIGAGATMSRVVFAASQQSEDVVHASNLADEAIHLLQVTQQYVALPTGGSGAKDLTSYLRLPDSQSRLLIPYATAASPKDVKWCVAGIGTAGGVDNACTYPTNLANAAGLGMQVSDMITSKKETIVVNRNASDTRLLVDATTTSGAVTPYSDPNWDYYTRTITITPSTTFLSGSSVTTYQVLVTVQNVLTKLQVQRSLLLTDHS